MRDHLDARIRRLQEFYWSELDPEGRGFVPLADTYRKDGDLPEARRLLKEGLGRHPDLVSGHVVLAWVLLEQGDAGEAESAFRAALKVDPENVHAIRGLARVLEGGGEGEEALELLKRLQLLDPLDEDTPARLKALEKELAEAPAPADEVPMGEDEDGAGDGGVGTQAEEAGPSPWKDAEGVADSLDWAAASIQKDESGYAPRERERPRGEEEEVVEEGGGGASAIDGALVTRTMGEIYLRQGLISEAGAVFRELLRRAPGDEGLAARLEEVDRLLEASQVGEGLPREGLPQMEAVAGSEAGAEPAPDEPAEVVEVAELAPDEPAEVVDIAELAPDEPAEVVDIAELAPDEPAEVVEVAELAPDEPAEVVDIAELAPDEPAEVVEVAELAPDEPAEVVDIAELAPDEPAEVVDIAELAPDDDVEGPDRVGPFTEGVTSAADEILPPGVEHAEGALEHEEIAPEEILALGDDLVPGAEPFTLEVSSDVILPIEALAPDVIVPIQELAPDPVVPIESLAPDGPEGDPDIDAFEAWLDKLR